MLKLLLDEFFVIPNLLACCWRSFWFLVLVVAMEATLLVVLLERSMDWCWRGCSSLTPSPFSMFWWKLHTKHIATTKKEVQKREEKINAPTLSCLVEVSVFWKFCRNQFQNDLLRGLKTRRWSNSTDYQYHLTNNHEQHSNIHDSFQK